MRNYKLVLLLKSDTKKEKKQKMLSDMKTWLGDIKNEKTTEIGEKKLAYPVKREKKADFVVVSFDADSVHTDFNNKIRMEDAILRHLLVRVD